MTLSENHRETILRSVEALQPELIAYTQELISCRTDSQSEGNPEFEPEARRCQGLVADQLRSTGMEVEQSIEPPRYPVTVGKLPGSDDGSSLAINGHVDVVPVGVRNAWTHDPWAGVVADGRLWGRGSCDMKGGVAAGIFAAKAIANSGLSLSGDLWVHVVADEEVVGMSTRRLASRLPRVDAVINAEPTSLRIMPVEGGLVHFRMEVEGRESHAGNRYKSVHAGGMGKSAGVNAIEKAIKIVTALQELERQWATRKHHPMLPAGFNTILPGIIMGGPGGGRDGKLNLVSNPGTTPDYCSVEFNVWYLPGESLEEIQQEIESYVETVCALDPWLRDHPPRFTWKLRNIWFPPVDTPQDHPFIQTLSATMESVGLQPQIEAFTAASELAWYAEQGMQGTIFGPGSIAQAHGTDEYVDVSELLDACKVMALTAADWCGIA